MLPNSLATWTNPKRCLVLCVACALRVHNVVLALGLRNAAALRTRSFDGNYRLSIVISTVALLLASTLVPSYVGSLFLLVLLTLLVCTVKSLRIARVVLHVALLAAASYAFVWFVRVVTPD